MTSDGSLVINSVDFKWIIPDFLSLLKKKPYIKSLHKVYPRENGNTTLNLALFISKKEDSIKLYLSINGDPIRITSQFSIWCPNAKECQHISGRKYNHENKQSNIFIAETSLTFLGQYLGDGSLNIFCAVAETTLPTTGNTLVRDLNKLLECKQCSDVTFHVDGERFQLHKSILSARSSVLDAMFRTNMEESKLNRVKIVDMKKHIFQAMIRYIYTGLTDDVENIAEELLVAADKYQLSELKSKSEDILMDSISFQNASSFLTFGDLYSRNLRCAAINFIATNIKRFVADTTWSLLNDSLKVEIFLETIQ